MCLFMVLQIQLLGMSVLSTADVSWTGHLLALLCGSLSLNTFCVGISGGFRYHDADLSTGCPCTILLSWTLRPAELSRALGAALRENCQLPRLSFCTDQC